MSRQRRARLRFLLSFSLLVALMAASTVVSADAFLRLPELWRASAATIDASLGPRLPGPIGIPKDADVLDEPLLAPPDDDTVAIPAPTSADEASLPEFAQSLRTEDYAESRRQAGVGPNRLGITRRAHQVRLGPDGLLTGRIVTLQSDTGRSIPQPGLRFRLLHRGTLAATGRTDDRGHFEIEGLTTATYAFIAAGDDALLAYSLHAQVQPAEENRDVPDLLLPEPNVPWQLECSAISGSDVNSALSQIATLQTDEVVDVSSNEPPEEEIPERVRPLEQTGAPGTPLLRHKVQLQPDGRLIGRVRYLHPESGRHLLPSTTRVMLIQQGEMVAVGVTDERGCFEVHNATPGVYSLVAVTISELLKGNIVEPDRDPTQPVALYDDGPRRPGYATFAVEVLPPGTLRRSDQPYPPPAGTPESEELLELDFALVDAYGMGVATEAASEITQARTSLPGHNNPAGSRLPRVAPSSSSSPPANTAPGGGGPVGWNTPILPPVTNDTPMMSPSTL